MDRFLEEYNRSSFPIFIPILKVEDHLNDEYNQVEAWLKTQWDPKAMTYLAKLCKGYLCFNNYITMAIELNPEYIPAYLTWILDGTIELIENYPDKAIKYGEKVLASGLFKAYYDDIYYTLANIYENKGNLVSSAQYTAKIMQSTKSFELNKILGPNITIEMADQIFSNIELSSFDLIQRLLEENKSLRREIAELQYSPGGIYYQEALKRFNYLAHPK